MPSVLKPRGHDEEPGHRAVRSARVKDRVVVRCGAAPRAGSLDDDGDTIGGCELELQEA